MDDQSTRKACIVTDNTTGQVIGELVYNIPRKHVREEVIGVKHINLQPFKCPVCQGRGQVPYNFYNAYYINTTTSIDDVNCKTCNGKGIIWG